MYQEGIFYFRSLLFASGELNPKDKYKLSLIFWDLLPSAPDKFAILRYIIIKQFTDLGKSGARWVDNSTSDELKDILTIPAFTDV